MRKVWVLAPVLLVLLLALTFTGCGGYDCSEEELDRLFSDEEFSDWSEEEFSDWLEACAEQVS